MFKKAKGLNLANNNLVQLDVNIEHSGQIIATKNTVPWDPKR